MENVKKDYFMDNHFRRKLHEKYCKNKSLAIGILECKGYGLAVQAALYVP